MKNEDYVSFELALKLKECGFDEPCLTFYDTNKELGRALDTDNFNHLGEAYQGEWFTDTISAPTLWQAQKWLRQAKGIAVNVTAHDGGKYDFNIIFLPNAAEYDAPSYRSPWRRTYEEALSEGIDTAVSILTCRDDE